MIGRDLGRRREKILDDSPVVAGGYDAVGGRLVGWVVL